MTSLNRIVRRTIASLGVTVAVLGLTAAPALSASDFDVELSHEGHEAQEVWAKATAGQYRVCFKADCSGDLSFDATASQLEAALNALPSIEMSSGTGSVSVLSSGPVNGQTRNRVIFDGGPLAYADVPALRVIDGSTPLSGFLASVATSVFKEAGVTRDDRRLDYTVRVTNSGPDPVLAGTTTTLVVELPGGLQTSVIDTASGGDGWSCSSTAATGSEPAKQTCTRSDALAAGESFPPVTVAAALGVDAPDHAIATATASAAGAADGSATDEFDFGVRPFGFEDVDSEILDADGDEFTQAGGHPFWASTDFGFVTRNEFANVRGVAAAPREITVDAPRGFVANALAVPELCPGVNEVLSGTCPAGSGVGEINVDAEVGGDHSSYSLPLFAIEPEYGLPAQFAFVEDKNINTVFTLSPRLRPEEGYAISLDASPAPGGFPALRRVNWGGFCAFGAETEVEIDGITGTRRSAYLGCKEADDATANPVPLVTTPTRCSGAPPTVRIKSDSWDRPGEFVTGETTDPMPTGCEKIDFTPEVRLTPTNNQADTPTGLDVEITMPTGGLLDPDREAQAMLANVEVVFPEGMSVNPAASHGLGSCAPDQIKLGSNADHECPLSSQVGTVEIETPLIRETLKGHVFMASQRNNPFDAMIGLYMVFASEKDGITVKIPGKLEADPVTGQLTSTFTENPEWPFSRAAIKFNSGPRAPLVNPPACGTYAIHSELSPWSAADPANPTTEEIVADDSIYRVAAGPNGAPCPDGRLAPDFEAGLTTPVAGGKSPFVLRLSRDDGRQRFTALDLDLPQGLVAYLKGVPTCSDAVLASISSAELTGRSELASPACPAASQVGTVQAGAGAGPYPFYASGRVFLAGPYKGAPLSLAVVTPAVAGPFDLGNVVVRNAVHINPVTAKVSVVSDPIPTIVHGLKLAVRDIRVNIDRPGFTAAPTNCEPQQVRARVGGEGGSSVEVANRFQVGECAALGFAPRISLRLKGGTKRGDNPALRAVVRPRPGDANIKSAAVTLPRSAFLDQSHIRTVCTRVQFAAESCPRGSVYGTAVAFTPLLDEPLRGPAYLRSSNNKLPDLVVDLRGPAQLPIRVEAAFRTDSSRGALRSTLDFAPDAPISRFVLQMQGGKKGLVINSRNLCAGTNRAEAKLTGHNGRRFTARPKVVAQGCRRDASGGKKRKKQARKGSERR